MGRRQPVALPVFIKQCVSKIFLARIYHGENTRQKVEPRLIKYLQMNMLQMDIILQLDGWIKKAEMKNYGFLFGKVNSVQNSGNRLDSPVFSTGQAKSSLE